MQPGDGPNIGPFGVTRPSSHAGGAGTRREPGKQSGAGASATPTLGVDIQPTVFDGTVARCPSASRASTRRPSALTPCVVVRPGQGQPLHESTRRRGPPMIDSDPRDACPRRRRSTVRGRRAISGSRPDIATACAGQDAPSRHRPPAVRTHEVYPGTTAACLAAGHGRRRRGYIATVSAPTKHAARSRVVLPPRARNPRR